MPFTRKVLFLKLWLWSMIGAVACIIIFLLAGTIAPGLQRHGDATGFADGVLYASVIGNAFGAGLVGYRVVDKYKTHILALFKKHFIQWTLGSFVVAIILVNTPLTPLMILWSFVAPYYVLTIVEKASASKK